jgi:hypothetical protein
MAADEQTMIFVSSTADTLHFGIRYQAREHSLCFHSAGPDLSPFILTSLVQLGRIYALEPQALPTGSESVSIDCAKRTGDGVIGRLIQPGSKQDEEEEKGDKE